jgi:hypothetical protein
VVESGAEGREDEVDHECSYCAPSAPMTRDPGRPNRNAVGMHGIRSRRMGYEGGYATGDTEGRRGGTK